MQFGSALRETCPTCDQPLPDDEAVFTTGVLEVRPIEGRVLVRGAEIHVTPGERRILVLLAANLGTLVTWKDLWEIGVGKPAIPADWTVQRHALRVYVTRLRKALGEEVAGYIESVRGGMTEGGLRLRRV